MPVAKDPVTVTRVASPKRVVGFSNSVSESLGPGSPQGSTRERVDPVPVTPDPVKPGKPTKVPAKGLSGLTISAGQQKSLRQQSPNKARSKVVDPAVCKARPKDNKPRAGGAGASKRFVPWCS